MVHGCRSCSKIFKRAADLKQHVKAPNGRCQPAFYVRPVRRRASRPIPAEEEWTDEEWAEEDDDTMDVVDDDADDDDERYYPEMDVDGPPAEANSYREYFPGAAMAADGGETFLNKFHADEHADKRRIHPFYPFATRGEWQIASWFIRRNISVAATDEFLKFDQVRSVTFKLLTISHLPCR